jgi:hypothetical protein
MAALKEHLESSARRAQPDAGLRQRLARPAQSRPLGVRSPKPGAQLRSRLVPSAAGQSERGAQLKGWIANQPPAQVPTL